MFKDLLVDIVTFKIVVFESIEGFRFTRIRSEEMMELKERDGNLKALMN